MVRKPKLTEILVVDVTRTVLVAVPPGRFTIHEHAELTRAGANGTIKGPIIIPCLLCFRLGANVFTIAVVVVVGAVVVVVLIKGLVLAKDTFVILI